MTEEIEITQFLGIFKKCPEDCPREVCQNDVEAAYKDLKEPVTWKKLHLFQDWMTLENAIRFGIEEIIGYDIKTGGQCRVLMNCTLYRNIYEFQAFEYFL